jgi:glycosyltransferase involved in cell wall biosynthesis
MTRKVLYVQYTNPAAYPPLEHSSRILANRGWHVLFLGTGAHGADALEISPHANIEVRRWKFVRAGFSQKLQFAAFNLWMLLTAVRCKPKWIYASDILACPAAFVLKRLGFRVLYHEHDSPQGGKAETLKTERLKSGNGQETPTSDLGSLTADLRPPSSQPLAPSSFQRFLLWSRTRLARRADLCVLPNERRVEMFRQATGRQGQTFCVWNCPAREEAEMQPKKSSNELIVFYHGSIVPDRLPASVIRSLADLPSSVRLRIAGYETVGHPHYTSELKEVANSLGMQSRFEYLGSLSRKALLPETRTAHVGLALMPMNSEDLNLQSMVGASNKPFEYMACGLALLVSDLPDWNAIFVDPGYARSCNPGDPESIASALCWFVEHPDETRAMGESGRQRVLQEWNYETQFDPIMRKLESP